MKKIARPCFSNGTEFADWTAANCDRCIKAPKTHLDQHDGLEWRSKSRCAIYNEIETQLMGYGNEPASRRGYTSKPLSRTAHVMASTEAATQEGLVTNNQLPIKLCYTLYYSLLSDCSLAHS